MIRNKTSISSTLRCQVLDCRIAGETGNGTGGVWEASGSGSAFEYLRSVHQPQHRLCSRTGLSILGSKNTYELLPGLWPDGLVSNSNVRTLI